MPVWQHTPRASIVDIAKQVNPSTSENLLVGSVQEPCLLWQSHGAHLMAVECLMMLRINRRRMHPAIGCATCRSSSHFAGYASTEITALHCCFTGVAATAARHHHGVHECGSDEGGLGPVADLATGCARAASRLHCRDERPKHKGHSSSTVQAVL
jgi:hypothetical protein